MRTKRTSRVPRFAAVALAALAVGGCGGGEDAPAEGGARPEEGREAAGARKAGRRQEEAARSLSLPVERSVDLGGGVVLDLVFVPAGEFDMGSPPGESGRDADEGPVHRVRIAKPFYMGKCEVTQEQWRAVMGGNPGYFKGPRNPVETVSWNDCAEFVRRLNGLGKGKFRLPAEAEWEYACRAGTASRYCFGYDGGMVGEYGWTKENASSTRPVGEKRANAWGLHDMHGNVWEWCRDRYGRAYYCESPAENPEGSAVGVCRVVRGGSWYYQRRMARCANRGMFDPSVRSYDFGLRVACAAEGP